MAKKTIINEFEVPSLEGLEKIDVTIPLKQACIVVKDAATENCPTNTGYLKRSITYNVSGNVGEVGTNVDYAPYIEFGTGLFAEDGNGRKTPWGPFPNLEHKYKPEGWKEGDEIPDFLYTHGQKPQPYLRPALDSNRDKIVEIFRNAIREGVK